LHHSSLCIACLTDLSLADHSLMVWWQVKWLPPPIRFLFVGYLLLFLLFAQIPSPACRC
jgi:hypothetical protein